MERRIFWLLFIVLTTITQIALPLWLAKLAADIDHACAALGFAAEARAFTPHLTLAREGTGNPHARAAGSSSALSRIAELLSSRPAPDFGTMLATRFHIYESKL